MLSGCLPQERHTELAVAKGPAFRRERLIVLEDRLGQHHPTHATGRRDLFEVGHRVLHFDLAHALSFDTGSPSPFHDRSWQTPEPAAGRGGIPGCFGQRTACGKSDTASSVAGA